MPSSSRRARSTSRGERRDTGVAARFREKLAGAEVAYGARHRLSSRDGSAAILLSELSSSCLIFLVLVVPYSLFVVIHHRCTSMKIALLSIGISESAPDHQILYHTHTLDFAALCAALLHHTFELIN